MFSIKIYIFLALLTINGIYAGSQAWELGPEGYHVRRTREGGSYQKGWLWGAHLTYDRVIPWGFYWAADGYYVWGCLEGKNSTHIQTRSNVHEGEIEGRLGYTIQWCSLPQFTPFIGGGYFHEVNHFRHPKEMSVKLKEWFSYASSGFLLEHPVSASSTVGILFSAKWLLEGRSKITDDPEFDTISLMMSEEMQYTVELPIKYTMCNPHSRYTFRLTPFYRYRHFGGHPNFPFDFVDTQFHVWGLRFTLNYQL